MANTNRDLFITFNVKTSSVSGENFNFYITDKKTSNFFVQLVTGVTSNAFISKYTTLENASNYELILNIIKPNNEVLQLIGTLMNEKDSIYQFDLKNAEKDLIGVYNCEFWIKSIVDGQEEITTSAPWTYKVSPSVTSNLDGVIEKDPDYPLVLQLKEDIEGLQQETRVIQQETQTIRDGYDSLIDQGVDDYVATHVSNTFSDLNVKIDNAETDIDSIQNNISTIETNIDSMQNNINTIETKNYEQDANLKCLFSHTSYNLDADVMGGNARLINSKEGIGHINSIHGNTMVNLCDQKDPMPLTKSYEVAGSNHIALQGEYNGKCKPYVYGNTLVNLMDFDKIVYNINCSVSQGVWTFQESESDWSIIVMSADMFKPNTTYTIIFNILENTTGELFYINNRDDEGSVFVNSSWKWIEGTTGLYKVALTTKSDISGKTLSMRTNGADGSRNGYVKGIPIILEGDWTNKDIPTHFTGLQSSFEDGLIPVNLATGEVVDNGVGIEFPLKFTPKKSTTYTVFVDCKYDDSTGAKDVWCGFLNTENNSWRSTQGSRFNNGIDVFKVTTFDQDDIGNTFRFGWDKSAVSNMQVSNLILLEGDYSNYDFSTYDSEHQGKYKVEYKVTGKNKFDRYTHIAENRNAGQNTMSYDETTGTYTLEYTSSYARITFNMSDLLPILRGKQARVSATFTNTVATARNIVYFSAFDKDNVYTYVPTNNYVIPENTTKLEMYAFFNNSSEVFSGTGTVKNIQIEFGDTVTAYESYKEDIKTLYLNSPLLEGDTVEVGGKYLYHVHRSKSITLDGKAQEEWFNYPAFTTDGFYSAFLTNITDNKSDTFVICDKIPSIGQNRENNFIRSLSYIAVGIKSTEITNISQFKQWLQQNPLTVVYELKTPNYEAISTNDDLYLDSYIGGHLDFNSVVPIEKVMFSAPYLPLKYMKTNTNYILQFKSDGVGKIDTTFFGGENNIGYSFNVVKGLNRFNMSTRDGKQNNAISIQGVGCTMSNIVVTESTDSHFGYFKGMQSCDNEIDVTLMNKNILPIQQDVKIPLFLEKGTTLILSTKNNALSKGGNVKLYNSANNVIWMGIDEGATERKLTLREDVYYIEKALQPCTDYELEYQLEIGDKKTEYVPHKSVTKHFTLSEPLRGLPNGVCDKIVEKDGKIYVERNCKEITLNGSQTGYLYTNENSPDCIIRGTPLSDGLRSLHRIVCDRLPYVHAGYSRNTKSVSSYGDANNGLAVYVSIPKNELKSADNSGIIEWLYQNPTTIIYQLETPTYELISEDDMEIKVFNNSSIATYSNIPVTKINLTYPTTLPSVYDIDDNVSTLSMVSDEQDMMLVDMATQMAVMQLTMM